MIKASVVIILFSAECRSRLGMSSLRQQAEKDGARKCAAA
jgi:hypothetical protein